MRAFTKIVRDPIHHNVMVELISNKNTAHLGERFLLHIDYIPRLCQDCEIRDISIYRKVIKVLINQE